MNEDMSITERLEQLDTAIVCDVNDEKGWPAPALDPAIKLQTDTTGPIVGFAYTIEGQWTHAKGPDRTKLKVVDEVPEGSVAVWSGTNARGICLFGDLLAGKMAANGCRGAIVDGGFRDRQAISESGFSVYARYSSPVQAVGRWRVTRSEEPVILPGALGNLVTVHPGDWILADADGIVVIAKDKVEETLDRAEEIRADEAEARKLGQQGMSTEEMLDRFGHV